jgi:hypothetical protein
MNDNQSLLCECGNKKAKRAVGCDRCVEIERTRLRSELRTVVYGIIARSDGVTSAEIREALEIGDAEAPKLYKLIERLVGDGEVTKTGRNSGTVYWARKRRAA